MGIRFECVHCGHTLHVKDYLAGKRGICPHCQGKIDIPRTSTDVGGGDEPSGIAVELKSAFDEQPTREMRPQDFPSNQAAELVLGTTSAPMSAAETLAGQRPAGNSAGDPIAEAPQLQWYVLPPGSMTKYGPAQGEMMRAWLEEGRVAADALVWREGWPQWRAAAAVFPRLAQTASTTNANNTISNKTAANNTAPMNAAPRNSVPSNASAVETGYGAAPATKVPVAMVPFEKGPIAQEPVTQRPVMDAAVTDDAAVVPYSSGSVEAVVLGGDDDQEPTTKRANVRHKPVRKMREQRTLIMALLVVLVVIFVPLLVWVLLNQ